MRVDTAGQTVAWLWSTQKLAAVKLAVPSQAAGPCCTRTHGLLPEASASLWPLAVWSCSSGGMGPDPSPLCCGSAETKLQGLQAPLGSEQRWFLLFS